MEARSDIETNITTSKPPPLNSDQLNYLIWRYLQESGYGEAAVKLQRDWTRGDSPQTFPFASRIKGRALIELVSRGLHHYHLSQRTYQNGQLAIPLQPSMFYFGPDPSQPMPVPNQEVDDENGAVHQDRSPEAPASVVRKHARESGPNSTSDHANQPAPKRSRKTEAANGFEGNSELDASQVRQLTVETNSDESAMDVDHVNGNMQHDHVAPISERVPPVNSAPRSPVQAEAVVMEVEADIDMGLIQEQNTDARSTTAIGGAIEPQDQERAEQIVAAPTYTLTNGHSIGIQITPAKVADLEPETKVLDVADAMHVTHVAWHPHDPTLLAADGEHFCGLWKAASANLRSEDKSLPYHSLVNSAEGIIVSAAAWAPDGSYLAVAIYQDQCGQLRIYDGQDVMLEESISAAQKMITSLRWQSVGSRLVAFAYAAQDSSLMLWDTSSPPSARQTAMITVPEAILDIDWASQGNASIICAAGDGVVYQCRGSSGLEIERKWTSEPPNEDAWSFVRCLWWDDDSAVIIAASTDSATLWIPTANVAQTRVHHAAITSLEVRPGQAILPGQASVHEFATASLDSTVKLWQFDHHANTIIATWVYSMGRLSPVLALSYSPDGFYVAGASYDTVHIWNARKGSQPVAKWEGGLGKWQGTSLKHRDSTNSGEAGNSDGEKQEGEEEEEEADHSLSWDADSKKLAFGLGKQVAIINFQR